MNAILEIFFLSVCGFIVVYFVTALVRLFEQEIKSTKK